MVVHDHLWHQFQKTQNCLLTSLETSMHTVHKYTCRQNAPTYKIKNLKETNHWFMILSPDIHVKFTINMSNTINVPTNNLKGDWCYTLVRIKSTSLLCYLKFSIKEFLLTCFSHWSEPYIIWDFSIYFKPRKFLFSKHRLVFANKRYNYKRIQFLGGKKNVDSTCYKEVWLSSQLHTVSSMGTLGEFMFYYFCRM